MKYKVEITMNLGGYYRMGVLDVNNTRVKYYYSPYKSISIKNYTI